MGILSALNTAVSGLDAQSDALGNISNNIAGSTTVGYKDLNTDFSSLVLESSQSPVLGGVRATTKQDVTTAGQLQTTGVSTDIAISGNGFLVVNTSAVAGAGTPLLTQAGSFRPDSAGNLVNAAGYYLQGQPLNEQGLTVDTSGNVVGPASSAQSSAAGLSTVNISKISVASSPTTAITFNANLPASETAYSATVPAPSTTAVTYYDDLGSPQTLTMTFTPTQAASGAAQTNAWTMTIKDSGTTSAGATGVTVGTMTMAFDPATGLLDATGTASSVGTYTPGTGILQVTTADNQSIGINLGAPESSSGMTQFDGSYTATKITSDGSSFGLMQSVSIGTDGIVTAAFSNGSTRPIYQLDIATVASPDMLAPVTGNAYELSPEAGVPLLNKAGSGPAGTTVGGTLEGSNVDLATELTNMIVTQRAYGSSATVIQTANQMLQTLSTLNQ